MDETQRALMLAHSIGTEVRDIGSRSMALRRGSRPTIYFEVDRAPFAAGPQSFIGELLARLGTRNIVTADLGAYPKLNPEYVVRQDPTVIFIAQDESTLLAERPGWDRIRAVKEHRVCAFAPQVRDTIVRPGPRVPEGHAGAGGLFGKGRAMSRLAFWLTCCLSATFLLACASLVIGTSSIQMSWHWLLAPNAQSAVILWQIRLPRTVGSWCVGALLGLCGATAQGVFRNPLAEPYLLGTASGAALGVAISLLASDSQLSELAWTGKFGVTGAAFFGACAATAVTIALSRGVLQTSSLLLAGIVVGFVLAAFTQMILLAKPEIFRAMQTFLLGSTAFLGWSSAGVLASVLGVCLIPAVVLSRGLDALSLGEETARSLGLSVSMLRLTLLAIVSLGTAAAVGQAGIVGFVGLTAPHLVRETLAVNHRQLLIAAPLCGGAMVQAADLLSRWIIRPAEMPVGAVTACVGGVYLIILLWRRNRDE